VVEEVRHIEDIAVAMEVVVVAAAALVEAVVQM
jgi:hypothetical protein